MLGVLVQPSLEEQSEEVERLQVLELARLQVLERARVVGIILVQRGGASFPG